nr:retrovirus-related Pol polyprotein from transposon TNT 1-94 [Tanacetum cinerariifolium]
MLVAQEIEEEGDADEHVEDVTAGDDAHGDDTAAHGAIPTITQEPSIPSSTPPTPPPQPPQDLPSTSQAANVPMSLLQEALDACAALTRRVENLEYDKVAQAPEITKLKKRVKKLEKGNKRRMIAEMDKDDAVVLMDDKEEDKKVEEAKEDETEPSEVQEVVDVVTTAKLITKVVTATSETVTTASVIIPTAGPQVSAATLSAAPARVAVAPSRRRKGVLKAKEDPTVKRYQAMKKKPEIEAQARKNMMMYLKNVAGFKLDYFKGMSYDDIHPIFEAKFNSNVDFLLKTKEQMEEEENRALQMINETPAEKAAKRRKLNEEVEDLKIHLEIVPDEDDDVYTEATPLSRKKNQRTVRGQAKVKSWKLLESCELHSHESNNKVPKNPKIDRYKTSEGYHAVPPLYTGTFLPPKPDLVFTDDPNASESVANVFNVESKTHKPSKDMSKTYRLDAPIVEDWIFDSEDETEIESMPKQRESSFVKSTERVKTSRESIKKVEHNKQAENLRNPKGGKISGKGKIKTCKLDFDDVYFVKELKFSLFSVLQMCDKKNSVLFIDTECVVLSSDYKLSDENHVLLRVPRENNMYNVDLHNGVPLGAAKDETSAILKTFITGIENQINHKVKIIRCENGTEFKNQDLNQFCRMKRIKREFSIARTPQQNVAERKNTTLIEAARTILAYLLLPIPFWAEAVNTAYYVQNRVLVTKPHNKTPYELLLGRSPSIGFMKPFGCHVTILNTLDLLEKFDGKADEGFLVRYSVNCKAFRVFNSRTRIVQETLHINFLENKPNVTGIGPKWLFDIDTLTMSMNYQPVEIVSAQQYVMLPLWSTGLQDPQNIDDDVTNLPLMLKIMRMMFMFLPMEVTRLIIRNMVKRLKEMIKERFVTHGRPNPINSTNNFNTTSPSVNAVSPNFRIAKKSSFVDPSKYLDDPDMLELEDIVYSDDEEEVGAEADLSNLETNIPINLILSTRVYKDHLIKQIIGDLNSAPQTRSMIRMVKEQGGQH